MAGPSPAMNDDVVQKARPRVCENSMSESGDILFGREGGVATITLNRPQALNALTLGMYRQFDPKLSIPRAIRRCLA